MAEHTPTPWQADMFNAQIVRGKTVIADVRMAMTRRYGVGLPEELEANVKFIARACNAHDALVEALQEAMSGDLPYPPHVVDMARAALELAGAKSTFEPQCKTGPSWFAQSKE